VVTEIELKPTKEHENADGLSKLPLHVAGSQPTSAESMLIIRQVQALPVTAE